MIVTVTATVTVTVIPYCTYNNTQKQTPRLHARGNVGRIADEAIYRVDSVYWWVGAGTEDPISRILMKKLACVVQYRATRLFLLAMGDEKHQRLLYHFSRH